MIDKTANIKTLENFKRHLCVKNKSCKEKHYWRNGKKLEEKTLIFFLTPYLRNSTESLKTRCLIHDLQLIWEWHLLNNCAALICIKSWIDWLRNKCYWRCNVASNKYVQGFIEAPAPDSVSCDLREETALALIPLWHTQFPRLSLHWTSHTSTDSETESHKSF